MARIGIDVRKIEDFGVGTYIQNLLSNLSVIDQQNEYVLFGYREGPIQELKLGRNFSFVTECSARYGLMEHIRLPWLIRKHKCSLFHSPHYVLPYFVPARPVVTIHDIIHILFPEYLPNRMAHRYAKGIMARSIRQAACVFTVSEVSKKDILDHFSVNPEKVHVIYNGLDETYFSRIDPVQIERAKERYRLDSPFLLYVGNIKPHKNVGALIDAFARIKATGAFKDHKLIIIGSDAARYPVIRNAILQGNLQNDVRILGWIPKDFLAAIYQMAKCFVYPSLYEGFGFPPLEAMASGTPVVCSSASSLPEIVRDAALTVNPMDTAALAAAMSRALSDSALRGKLIERGLENVKRFSWNSTAQKVLACYNQVL